MCQSNDVVAVQVVAMTVATVVVADKTTPMWLHHCCNDGRDGRIDHEVLVEVVVE